MYRIAFDPSLPVVAAGPFMAKGTQFAAGAPVDWRALGVSERDALDWWLAGLISHPVSAKTAPPASIEPKLQSKRSQRSR